MAQGRRGQFVWAGGLNPISSKGFCSVQSAIGAREHSGEVVAVRCRKTNTDGCLGLQALCSRGCDGEPA
ncbi:hypothetical protein, partial [Rhizobium sp. Leaf306]|uniref:hypothetical protein n=1 Tax=Rhizobium sp. Leaf306 TaxID=1736330 RepID=UPI001AEC1EB3